MDQEMQNKMAEMERKIDEIYVSVEKTRKYFLWTMIITVAVVVLPMIGLMFVIPSFLGNYTDTINTLGGL
jgi:hypothetical protein